MRWHRRDVPNRSTQRPDRLLLADRRRTGRVDREPPLLPARCPRCHVVLGLVIAGGEVLCRTCGVWAPAAMQENATNFADLGGVDAYGR